MEETELLECRVEGSVTSITSCVSIHTLIFPDMLWLQLMTYFQFGQGLIQYPLGLALCFSAKQRFSYRQSGNVEAFS